MGRLVGPGNYSNHKQNQQISALGLVTREIRQESKQRMLNLKGLIKSAITENLDFLVEDFTENDIEIDRWNGRIQKENVKIKKDAFEWLTKLLIGAPCTVVQGYIKKLQVDIPWSELQSRPIEVTIEDLHVILTSSECYQRQFVKDALLELKKLKVNELCKVIEDRLKGSASQSEQASAEKSGFVKRMTQIILENLRINVRHVHIRFEDNLVSRRDQAFNFGIISESITYSMTNNRFVRAFLNIDDKLQEQRSFSMLKILKLAAYWNSNAQDNWTKSREFIYQGAQGTIAFSRSHMEILMSKHNASKQDMNHSNVFLLQPTDISFKFRTNLAPQSQLQIPVNTTSIEFSDVTLSLDEEVLKDIQLVSKFFAWHAMSIHKQGYLKYRPPYNVPVKGNARTYWRYAIRATIYLLRKQQQEQQDPSRLQKKQKQEMIELSELYRLEKVNEYLRQAGSSERHLQLEDKILVARFRKFRNEAYLAKRRKHLECKLQPEQIVVALKKAEKDSQVFIVDHQAKSGWRAWVPSMFKNWYSSSEEDVKKNNSEADSIKGASTQGMSAEDAQFHEQMEQILAKTNQLQEESKNGSDDKGDDFDGVPDEQRQRSKPVLSHLTVIVPLIELLVVSRQHGAYNAKCFMSTALQDIFYQNLYYKDRNTQQLFSLRSIDVIDKLVQSPKFQRAIYKGPIRQIPAQQQSSDLAQRAMQRFSRQNMGMAGRLGIDNSSSLQEVEEESNPFANNGLPRIRYFQDITRNVGEVEKFFFLFQMIETHGRQPQGVTQPNQPKPMQTKYKIDTMLNHAVLFYNRMLISRAQTFFHQATVGKTQNAQAEADFDSQMNALMKEKQDQVNDFLERSDFEVSCALKGVEMLVPDDTNFQESKFLLLQTGNLVARSRQPQEQKNQRNDMDGYDLGPHQPSSPQQHQQSLDPLFTSALQEKLNPGSQANLLSSRSDQQIDIDQVGFDPLVEPQQQFTSTQVSFMRILDSSRSKDALRENQIRASQQITQEDYSLTVFDIQLLYLPSFNFLEAIQYNEVSKEKTDKQFSLLKRTDLSLDFSKIILSETDSQVQGAAQSFRSRSYEEVKSNTMLKVGLSIANIDCRMTTKEVKEFKNFADKFMQYHRDLEDLVQDELNKIHLESQFRQSIDRNQNQIDEAQQRGAQSHRELNSLVSSLAPNSARSYTSSLMAPSFKTCTMGSSSQNDGSDDDEFFDAVDHFDQEIIDLLSQAMQKQQEDLRESPKHSKMGRLHSIMEASDFQETNAEDAQENESVTKEKTSSTKLAFCASLNIGKIRFQVLEASDVREELVKNLRERLQQSYNNEPIELHVQQKGLPFLNFEISQTRLTVLSAPSMVSLTTRPELTTDLLVSTVSVRDFCLMNQEKVSQPQILLRSSNYEVEQARFATKDRTESFDRPRSSDFGGGNSKTPDKGQKPHYFDIEEEDNMAMVEQAPEEVTDFFIRCKIDSTVANRFETKHRPDEQLTARTVIKKSTVGIVEPESELIETPEETEQENLEVPQSIVLGSARMEYSLATMDTKVSVDVNLGLTEGEVTEHSMRKIMDCLVADFPISTSSATEESTIQAAAVKIDEAKEDEEAVAHTTSVKARLRFDGLNYKMRLRKEETVVKIIDLACNFTDWQSSLQPQSNERDIEVDLVDFQVLHQNNELIFKHSFGTDFMLDDDKSLGMPGETKILSITFRKVGDDCKFETKLNNFLVIFESMACLQILQNVNTLRNVFNKTTARFRRTQPNVNQSAVQPASSSNSAGKLKIAVTLNQCNVQLPVAESKNSLFIELSSLSLTNEGRKISAQFQAIDIYVAKQINQNKKYFLVQLHRSSLLADIGSNGLLQRLDTKLGLVRLTMNENYLLFLASLIEYHFNDVTALLSFTSKLTGIVEPTTTESFRSTLSAFKTIPEAIDDSMLRNLSASSPFLKSIIATEKQVNTERGQPLSSTRNTTSHILKILRISIESVSLEWVFGLGFDDHEESFVTLNNRNFSKLILDQFDRTRQLKVNNLLEPSQEVLSDYADKHEVSQLLDPAATQPGIRKSASRANQLDSASSLLLGPLHKQGTANTKDEQETEGTSSSYEKLTLSFKDILVEQVKAVSENVYLNSTCRQIMIEQRSPQLRQAYPVLLIRPQATPESLKVTCTQSTLKAELSFFDLRVCQRTVTAISNLVKDVYSCKNVIKRGKKRRFFRALFKKSRSSADQQQQAALALETSLADAESSFEVSADVRKIRILMYDSTENEAKRSQPESGRQSTPARNFVRKLQTQAIEDFGDDPDQEYFQPGSLLTLETGVRISNLKPVRPQDEEELETQGDHEDSNDSQDEGGYQPDRQLNVKVTNFSIFTNTGRTTLMEIPSKDQRLMLLYPTDLVIGQQFYSQKNLSMIDIQVSIIEFETSFKQVFLYQLLFKKIIDASKPVTQIFEYIDSQNLNQKDGVKLGGMPSQRAPKSGTLLSMHINSIYFALIKELHAGNALGDPQGEANCMPMLSLEVKWFELRQKSQITGLQQTDVTFPLELYYFNQRLNFFEPAIERVLIKANVEADVNGNSEKRFTVEDVLNVNFSVALYENIFVLLENLTYEREAFKKMIEQTERENLMASLRTLNGDKQGAAATPGGAATHNQSFGYHQGGHDSFLQSHSLNFIKNKTGELLLFKPGRQPAFTEMQANETLPLDFQKSNLMGVGVASGQNLLSAEDNTSKGGGGLFDGVASSEMQPDSDNFTNNWPDEEETSSEDGESEPDADEMSFMPYQLGGGTDLRTGGPSWGGSDNLQKPRSLYRRGKYKFKKSEPNRVVLQVLIRHGKELERTPSFEINFDSLSCQRVFLDENRELYVICQIQNKDGQKILIVRSPMQVTNNLQIPVEVLLHSKAIELQSQKQQNGKASSGEVEETKEQRRNMINRQDSIDFSLVIKPEQSMIIPLQACSFKNVQIRPLIPMAGKAVSSMYSQESQFEWSQKANVSLLQDERLIFEQKPIILCSRMTRNSFTVDRNNNQVFFALNANTYSIRSYIDFNTQQTDFISLRYLSITAPFTIQNLIPVPITMLFKNVERVGNEPKLPSHNPRNKDNTATTSSTDPQMYDLELKHNSSLQILYLNPLGNFDFSLAIPGYDQSNFVKFKLQNEADYELCSDLSQSNYLESLTFARKQQQQQQKQRPESGNSRAQSAREHQNLADEQETSQQTDPAGDEDFSQLLQTAQFRFVKQKKLLLQLCSQFQSQFNICANIAFVQGFYHVSFYAKYWFLNNTQMPLQARVSQQTFSYPTLDLPYLSLDFDFDTAKQFQERDVTNHQNDKLYKDSKKGIAAKQDEAGAGAAAGQPAMQRRDSGETFVTETVREGAAQGDEHASAVDEDSQSEPLINYKRLKSNIRAIDASGETYSKGGMLRVKPWEAYRYNDGLTKGVLAALSQEDIDRVSSIYFTQEMIKEEEKEEEKGTDPELTTARDQTKSDAFLTAFTHSQAESSTEQFMTARMPQNRESGQQAASANSIQPSQLMQQQPAQKQEEKRRTKQVQFSLVPDAEPSQTNSKGSGQFSNNRLAKSLDANHLMVEKLTKYSKSTIQMASFQHNLNAQQAVPLNHTILSQFEIYEAPLEDKDQLQRVILFSDVPTDEMASGSNSGTQVISMEGPGSQGSCLEPQKLRLRVCDSEWSSLDFDLTRLQSEPIKIKDVHRKEGRPQSLFELVAVVTFLPQPFSFSKLICFQPRYLMVNRTFHTLYVVQSQCEELGTFKIFPQETSVFHWSDADKPLEVCVTLNDHEYSGELRIDSIGEFCMRLKNKYEQDSTILNVSISEETNSFYIAFTDVSYAPPYRLENLTKTRFNVAQVMARPDDFDHLNPFQPLSFAWSYPLRPKLLRISLSQIDSQEDLGSFNIDSIQKTERVTIKDRHRRRNFILEITNENAMKVVRILHPQQTLYEDALEQKVRHDEEAQMISAKHSKLKVQINRLGLSLINQQAREICYTSIFNLRFSLDTTSKHQKVAVKAADLQIDNQLSRSADAIILKREQMRLGHGDFLQVKFHLVKNQAIENLLYYKYLIFSIVPFELNLDGNFCDETYKYILEVFQLTSKFTSRSKVAASAELLEGFDSKDPTSMKQPTLLANVGDEVEQIKSAFNELKKKGQPYMDTQRDVKKIYIEQFQISEIRLNFTFSSSPILFREFTMNPTLKFFLVLLSNLKNVRLQFSKYHLQNQHMLLNIFLAQLKRFYWRECCNHKQLFKIVSSMGLFGSISTTITGISTAFKSLIQRPFITYHQESTIRAILLGSVVFVKDSLWVLSGSVGSIYETFRNGFSVLIAYGQQNQEVMDMVVDRDLFEDDIEQAQKGITAFSTPLTAIDTQNRIWLKILMREQQSLDDKKRIIMRKQQNKMDQQSAEAATQAEGSLKESSLTKTSGPTRQYIIDTRSAQYQPSLIYKMAYFTTQGVLFLPRKILDTGKLMLSSFIPDEIGRSRASAIMKVRPPRFVSFTMELEPYSKKKAFALEILNDINLNVAESEAIHQLYSMNAHVVIITGKRIICVDEHRNTNLLGGVNSGLSQQQQRAEGTTGQKIISGLEKMIPRSVRPRNQQFNPQVQPQNAAPAPSDQGAAQTGATQNTASANNPLGTQDTGAQQQPNARLEIPDRMETNSVGGSRGSRQQASGLIEENQGMLFDKQNSQYRHWNVFFKDIYRVSIDIVDRETNMVISQQDLERLLHGTRNAAAGHRGAGGSAPNLGMAAEGLDRQLKIYFVLKIYYQLNEDENGETEVQITGSHAKRGARRHAREEPNSGDGAGLIGGLSGLKVGRKQIISRDWKVMRRVYTAIQNYQRKSTLI